MLDQRLKKLKNDGEGGRERKEEDRREENRGSMTKGGKKETEED
jgi:hypothetical protein